MCLLHNFSYVVDGVLAGCAHPSTYGDLRQALQELLDKGIGALVSLDEVGIPLHAVAEYGFPYLHLPIPDFGAPSMDQARQFVEFVEQQRQNRRAVAVHCHAGYGRTGTMLACYLVTQGLSANEAIKSIRSKRPGSIETHEQERFITEFEQDWRQRGIQG